MDNTIRDTSNRINRNNMKLNKWILGTKKGSSKIEIVDTVEQAQVHLDGGWEYVVAVNRESARVKYRDLIKGLNDKTSDKYNMGKK